MNGDSIFVGIYISRSLSASHFGVIDRITRAVVDLHNAQFGQSERSSHVARESASQGVASVRTSTCNLSEHWALWAGDCSSA